MARKLFNDAICHLLPFVNNSESGVSIRIERQKVSETYNEDETESDSTKLVWKLFVIRHAKLLTVSEFDTREHLKKIAIEAWKNFVWVKPKTVQAF